MLHKLLFLIALFGASHVMAQGNALVKTTEKPADTQIDYTQLGMPMPPLRYIVYRESNKKNAAGANENRSVNQDSLATGKKPGKKKHKENAVPTGVNINVTKAVLINEDLENNANLFVMIFNPNCSHCQDETMLLGQNGDLFKKSKLVLVAGANMHPYMDDFIKYTNFEKYPFMYLGIDSSDYTKKVFLYKALPQINIYNKHRKLIKTFSGEIVIDSLKKYIQ